MGTPIYTTITYGYCHSKSAVCATVYAVKLCAPEKRKSRQSDRKSSRRSSSCDRNCCSSPFSIITQDRNGHLRIQHLIKVFKLKFPTRLLSKLFSRSRSSGKTNERIHVGRFCNIGFQKFEQQHRCWKITEVSQKWFLPIMRKIS